MKRIDFKSALALVLTLAVAIALAGCGATNSAAGVPKTTATTTSAAATDQQTTEEKTTETMRGTEATSSTIIASSTVILGKTTSSKTGSSATKLTTLISSNTEAPLVSKSFFTCSLTEREPIQNGETIAIVAEKKMESYGDNRLFDKNYSNNKLTLVSMANTAELDMFINTIKECAKNISVYDYEYWENRYQRYDEEYFQQNTLMALFFPYSSSSIKAEVTSLIRRNDEICIECIMKSPKSGAVNDDVDFRFVVIEVKTADISGVKTWGYHMESQTY